VTVVNIVKFDAGLASIDAGEREWDQFDWRCGTGGCFAAHAALATGWVWAMPQGPLMLRSGQLDGDLVDVSELQSARVVAVRELDLTQGQADAVFHENNTRRVLQALRDCLAEQPDAGYYGLRALAKEVRKAEMAEMAERRAKRDAAQARGARDLAVDVAEARLARELADTDPQRTPRGWQQVDV
jgi:hypothetical protein